MIPGINIIVAIIRATKKFHTPTSTTLPTNPPATAPTAPIEPPQILFLTDFSKTAMGTLLKNLLSKHQWDSEKQFVYKSADAIEAEGGICLTPCSRDHYIGIAISKEKSQYVLHICPGGGILEFILQDFYDKMPQVAQEVVARNINPDFLVIDGRHHGNTLATFQEWQRNA